MQLFSLTDQQMKQSVSLNAAELMDNIDGWLVVVSNNNVFELVPTSIEKQVECLHAVVCDSLLLGGGRPEC